MFADTDAIRALGSANSNCADDLAAVAASLSSLPVAAVGSSLGPVGADFLALLQVFAADGSRAVAAISDHLSRFSTTAHLVASTYDSADHAAGARVTGV